MTVSFLLICILSQCCLAGGQLLVKHALNRADKAPFSWSAVVPVFSLGIGMLAGWFFLWGALLQRNDLSYIYPFEGLSPVLVVLGAALFLREKLTLRSCLGITLISIGVALVASS